VLISPHPLCLYVNEGNEDDNEEEDSFDVGIGNINDDDEVNGSNGGYDDDEDYIPSESIGLSRRGGGSKYTQFSSEEQPGDANSPSSLSYDCPKCPYRAFYDPAKVTTTNTTTGQQKTAANKQIWALMESAKGSIIRHYTRHHIPVSPKDLTKDKDGNDCFACLACPSTFPVFYSKHVSNQHRLNNAHHKLARHYLNTHEGLREPPRPSWISNAGGSGFQLDGLMEGRDYYRCPKEDCPFLSILPPSKDSRAGLPRLAGHYLKMHESERIGFTRSTPCLGRVGETGQEVFKWPRCEFTSVVEDSSSVRSRRTAQRVFLYHFVEHIYTAKKNKPRDRIPCTLCDFVAEKNPKWKLQKRRDQECRMRNVLMKHFERVHDLKDVPGDVEFYEVEGEGNIQEEEGSSGVLAEDRTLAPILPNFQFQQQQQVVVADHGLLQPPYQYQQQQLHQSTTLLPTHQHDVKVQIGIQQQQQQHQRNFRRQN
jgi:hypothetical protein